MFVTSAITNTFYNAHAHLSPNVIRQNFLNQVHLWYDRANFKIFIFEWFMLNTNHPEDGISAKNENKGNRLDHITEMHILKYSVSSHLTAGMCSLRKTCWQEQSWSRENFQFRQLLTTLDGILRDQNFNIACLVIFRMIEVLRCCCETQMTVYNGPACTYTRHSHKQAFGGHDTYLAELGRVLSI
jgi:hypothetical protein